METTSYSQLVEFQQARFRELDITFNEWDEMMICAVDLQGNQVGRSGGLPTPKGPFLLLFNPDTLDWQTMKNLEPIDGYHVVKAVLYAE